MRFEGLLCLYNPKYNLHIERHHPAVKKLLDESDSWGYSSDCILRYLDEKTNILEIARRHCLKHTAIHDYSKKLVRADVISEARLYTKSISP
jgi:hypothetical protein